MSKIQTNYYILIWVFSLCLCLIYPFLRIYANKTKINIIVMYENSPRQKHSGLVPQPTRNSAIISTTIKYQKILTIRLLCCMFTIPPVGIKASQQSL